jgi:hypothetical protein
MVDITEGNPDLPEVNGGIPVHMAQSLAYMKTAKALQDAMKLLGRPAEIMLGTHLNEGEMYVVNTSISTDAYAAEDPGRILIVHRGMLEEAQVMKASLDAALDEDEDG